ncbi:MAG TPA: YihY/virulence factor BrkB family protein [Bacteroidia bacterium]|nr:YihY/virulence factor BrkB family protein [Bacteroidia bacterium]
MPKTASFFKASWLIIKKTALAWYKADPFRQSAIIAYYAIFSMPALLLIIIACAAVVFGQDAVTGQISNQIGAIMGKDAALQIQDMIAKANNHKNTIWASIVGVATLLLGCTGVFEELQVSLNQIWEVKVTAKKKWLKSIKDRLFSFGLILSIGFLLLVSLTITTILAAFSAWIKNHLPDFTLIIFHLIDFLLSFGIIAVLFALMFKILPDAKVKWKNVWVGAMVTAFLFILGKYGLGFYFGKTKPASTYGTAGSIILIMLWVSYSCMIVFFGAEFTKQFTLYNGGKIEPTKDAELIITTEEEQLVIDKKQSVKNLEK